MTKNNFCFIFENTSIISANQIKILEEATDRNGNTKIAFETNLQTADEKNQNNRIYSKRICENITNQLAVKAKKGSLMMEIDHPMFISDSPEILKKRAAVVEVNNSAAKLRKIFMRGKDIIGEVETLSGFKGPDFANLIVRDRVNIGFSLRALGSVEPMTDGTLMVKNPITPITYDIVSNPSHSEARILKFLPESCNDYIPDSSTSLMESVDNMGLEECLVCEGGQSVMRFIDDIIKENFNEIMTKKIKFLI